MKTFNIYLTGVGGQGIGLISEILLRASDHANLIAKGCDTHGLAQRGGVVASQLRIGTRVHTPLISKGQADLVISLERHEALRSAATFLKTAGTLLYYDTSWQPLSVREGIAQEITNEDLADFCSNHQINCFSVFVNNLPDTRMQNIALLAEIEKQKLIPNLAANNILAAMQDLMEGKMLEANQKLFEKLIS